MSSGKRVQIVFNKEKKEQLRAAYNKAVSERKKVFMFEEQEVLVKYAKYLLEYLDTVL